MTSMRVLKLVVTMSGFAALGFWLGFIALFQHLIAISPKTPDTVRTVRLFSHGFVAYISSAQEVRLEHLRLAAIVLFVPTAIGAFLSMLTQRK